MQGNTGVTGGPLLQGRGHHTDRPQSKPKTRRINSWVSPFSTPPLASALAPFLIPKEWIDSPMNPPARLLRE
ncbi:hypothetical protein PBY51_023849 [Eleginops maclovinus]|uniref:Uncharacterized protein n=1 Tax=Eleginops maclovinus TaxID=56733 RepID=A0AAN7WZJ8_ELEMC|nr:hypothetical protein PBY51_023849 [Eleginops maclovinus]